MSVFLHDKHSKTCSSDLAGCLIVNWAVGGHNMGMSEWMPLFEFAITLATECGGHAISQFRQHPARHKDDGSLVTATDLAIDHLIVQRLAAHVPAHRVLSEEQVTSYDAKSDFTWVVDPIDGTTNFARGLPIWGISIALLYQGRPVVGVVHFPLLQETFSALAGGGAQRNKTPIHTGCDTSIGREQLIMKCTRTDKLLQIRTRLKSRICGSAAYHLCKVADGTAMMAVEATPKIWDLAAAWLVVVEAGGIVESWQQQPIFPLAAVDGEYVSRPMPVFAAANQSILHEFVAELSFSNPQ